MKLKLAVIGYGNLGKSLEKEIEKNSGTELAAIYSRRYLDNPKYRPLNEIEKADDFDAALIALGSYGDVMNYAEKFKNFDTVDSFDTHAEISKYKSNLEAIKPDRISIISTGWDPGLLSLARAALGTAADEITTVWGKGISQGHSNAVRTLDGVLDAVQFTLPNGDCEKKIRAGITDGAKLHKRLCYVAAIESDKEKIEREIKSMPHYFDEYETEVRFVTPQEVRELKKQTSHIGQVFTAGDGFTAKARIDLDCNADFTAKIMLRYALALPRLKADGYKGALDVFDIPLKYIADKKLI